MKRITATVAVFGLLSLSIPAFAQNGVEQCIDEATGEATTCQARVPEQFVNILDDLRIVGDIMRPSEHFVSATGRADFDSLVQLRRSFVGEIMESAEQLPF